MTSFLDLVRAVVPPPARRWLRRLPRQWAFSNAMRQLAGGAPLTRSLARRLIYGWANEGMSASEEFLRTAYRHARSSRGPILECGSGLSSLVLGIAARRNRQRVFSLENDPYWAALVRDALRRFGIDNVEVCLAPLGDYGDYKWYEPPRDRLPRSFALVVCDGPQGTTPGGRYGLLPVLGRHLGPGCVILLDDAMRDGEQQVLARWRDELHATHELFGKSRAFARVLVPPMP